MASDSQTQLVMQPVTFDGCFGWLHTSAASDIAVVLCAGLRRDASNAHRPFRLLADRFAAAGYPTLRFDYRGTGDSTDAEGAEYWMLWQHNIMMAADYARVATGARHIVLIGLRIGAALATQVAAERCDVSGLILLDPILRGRSYITQLTVEARLRDHDMTKRPNGLLLDDLRLTEKTVQRIRQHDSTDVVLAPECRVAIFSQSQSSSVTACTQVWASTGVAVTTHGFTGLEPLLQPAHLADQSQPDFTPILSWLRTACPTAQLDDGPVTVMAHRVALRHGGWVETPLHFGQHRHLFGMLCRPKGGARSDLAVVIGNPGGDPHHGYARFSVEFARRLATRGIASLRIDFAGLGDSAAPCEHPGADSLDVFQIDRSGDYAAAFDALEPLGFHRFALHGLCSGAYHALQASLVDPRVAALLLINLPWFSLRHERSGPHSFARHAMATLASRQVARLLLFAPGDAGLRPLEQHFGPDGAQLCNSDDVEVAIVPGFDHDLSGHAMHRDAADRMIGFLLQAPSLLEHCPTVEMVPGRALPGPAELSHGLIS